MKKLLIWGLFLSPIAFASCNSISEKKEEKKACFTPKIKLFKGRTLQMAYEHSEISRALPVDTLSFNNFRKQVILEAAANIDAALVSGGYQPYALEVMNHFLDKDFKKVQKAAKLHNHFWFYLDEKINPDCSYTIELCVVKRAGEEALKRLTE